MTPEILTEFARMTQRSLLRWAAGYSLTCRHCGDVMDCAGDQDTARSPLAAAVDEGTMSAECPVCTRPASSPYRVYDDRGKVIQGCVASFHDGALTIPSESARWHARPEARRIRKTMARFTR